MTAPRIIERPRVPVVTLLSGGQDSTTALFWALKYYQPTLFRHVALSFDYGQTHARELWSAAQIAKRAGVEHVVVNLQSAFATTVGGASALTSPSEITTRPDGLPSTFVPGRNLIFLAHAASLLGRLSARGGYIVLGVSAVDYSGYPDCRPRFVSFAGDAITAALDADVMLLTPLLPRSKRATVELARELGPACWAALADSWTCYRPQPPSEADLAIRPCGVCPACVLRAQGFAEAGEQDPAL